jgi:hypothetical protein
MNLPLAPLGAVMLGVAAAALCALLPGAIVEQGVMASGLPAVIAAAEPPLGLTGRATLALGVGGLAMLFGWFGLFVVLGSRSLSLGTSAAPDPDALATPVLRRADAHPDAPPRPPLLATRDLGTPFLEITAKRAAAARALKPQIAPAAAEVDDAVLVGQELPRDLEQPLAAFDPSAIPETPATPSVSVLPLCRDRPAVFHDSERFEIFELTPPVRPRPAPPPGLHPAPRPAPQEEAIAAPRTDATIHALLDRLERGVAKRGIVTGIDPEPRIKPQHAERGLEDALVTLRNLARRA